ncbi:hypothetical protein PR048_033068, partial [Dryococelus australis]
MMKEFSLKNDVVVNAEVAQINSMCNPSFSSLKLFVTKFTVIFSASDDKDEDTAMDELQTEFCRSQLEILADNIVKEVEFNRKDYFLTTPYNNADCERIFSQVKTRTQFRSSRSNVTSDSLMVAKYRQSVFCYEQKCDPEFFLRVESTTTQSLKKPSICQIDYLSKLDLITHKITHFGSVPLAVICVVYHLVRNMILLPTEELILGSAPLAVICVEFSRAVIETRSGEEPPGTKVECYSEENNRMESDSIPSDSDKAETYLYTRVLVCKLCNLVSTDCKCQQHCEALYLSAEHEDVTGELPNSPSPQCNDKYMCDLCGIAYVVKRDLIQHISIHGQKQTLSGNVSGRSLSRKSDLILQKTHSVGHTFSCDLCSKSFGQKSNLVVHHRTHSGERLFSCDLCSKSFSLKRYLVLHQRTHSGERPFSCDLCSKSFSVKKTLVKHIRTHSGEQPFSCDLCSKSFSVKNTLVKHIRTHSRERPFSCDLCSKSFSEKSVFIMHSKTHSGEQPFSCDLCSKSFSLKGNLVVHQRTHSGERPFSCDLCNKSFSQKSNLVDHSRTHSGEHPFSCDLCSKSFSLKGNLVVHQRTHSGERPFSCDLCSKSFKEKGVLFRHIRTHSLGPCFKQAKQPSLEQADSRNVYNSLWHSGCGRNVYLLLWVELGLFHLLPPCSIFGSRGQPPVALHRRVLALVLRCAYPDRPCDRAHSPAAVVLQVTAGQTPPPSRCLLSASAHNHAILMIPLVPLLSSLYSLSVPLALTNQSAPRLHLAIMGYQKFPALFQLLGSAGCQTLFPLTALKLRGCCRITKILLASAQDLATRTSIPKDLEASTHSSKKT